MAKKRDIAKIIPSQLIRKIQENFCETLDVALTIYSVDGKNITRESNTNKFWKNFIFGNPMIYPRCKAAEINAIKTCIEQKSAYIYKIYCDIAAFAVPISINNEIIAVCVGGKVRMDNPNLRLCKIEAENIKADFDVFLEKYLGIPMMEAGRLLSMANLLKHTLETILELNISKKTSKEKIDEMEMMKDMLQKEIYSKTKNMYETNQKYKSIIENAIDIILTLSQDGIITEINRAVENDLWSTREEVIGSHFSKFIPLEYALKIKKMIKDCADKKIDSVKDLTIPICDLSENVHYFSANAKAIYDRSGNLEKIQCIMREITHQKQLEQELKEAKEEYVHLFEAIKYGIYMADLEGNIIKTNESMRSLFGYSEEELKNVKIWNLYTQEEKIKECVKEIVKDKSETMLNAVAKNKNGEDFYVEFSLTTINDQKGKTIGHGGIIRNISSKIEYITKAKSEKTKYQSLFENVREGIILTNEAGEITEFNPAAYYIFKGKIKNGINIKHMISAITEEKMKRLERKGEIAIKCASELKCITGIKINFNGQSQIQWICDASYKIDYMPEKKSLEQFKETPVKKNETK